MPVIRIHHHEAVNAEAEIIDRIAAVSGGHALRASGAVKAINHGIEAAAEGDLIDVSAADEQIIAAAADERIPAPAALKDFIG